MIPSEIFKPGMHYVNMMHDHGCPSIDSLNALDCECNPEFSVVSEAEWIKGVQKTRKERRKAARTAQKALRKIQASQ